MLQIVAERVREARTDGCLCSRLVSYTYVCAI